MDIFQLTWQQPVDALMTAVGAPSLFMEENTTAGQLKM